MRATRCEAVRDALAALAAGRLDDGRTAAIEEHVASCAECAAERDLARALLASRVAAPAGLADRITRELARRAHGRRNAPGALRWIGAAGLAAAAGMALLLAWPDARSVERQQTARVAADAPAAVVEDPFMDETLLDASPVRPQAIALDRAMDEAARLERTAAETPGRDETAPAPLAMDVGSELGDWPGADGVSAGEAVLDQLSYEQMQLLLSEMDT